MYNTSIFILRSFSFFKKFVLGGGGLDLDVPYTCHNHKFLQFKDNRYSHFGVTRVTIFSNPHKIAPWLKRNWIISKLIWGTLITFVRDYSFIVCVEFMRDVPSSYSHSLTLHKMRYLYIYGPLEQWLPGLKACSLPLILKSLYCSRPLKKAVLHHVQSSKINDK